MMTCRTCGATYEPLLVDGTAYYHACPPLSPRELKAGLADHSITWTPAQQAQLDAAAAADAKTPPGSGTLSLVDQTLASFTVERPNGRNENAPAPAVLEARIAASLAPTDANYHKTANQIRATTIISPGAGATVTP